MKTSEIENYAKKVNNPSIQKNKVAIQVWQDGKITFHPKGKNIHTTKKGHPKNKVDMPIKFVEGKSYAYVNLDEAYKISEMIFNIS